MRSSDLEELWRRKKRQTIRVQEVSDLTRQLAEAAGRHDQVSVELMLSMREGPLQELYDMDQSIDAYLGQMPKEDAVHARLLLSGGAPGAPEEKALCDQVSQFRRILEAVVALDEQISLRLGGKNSFYQSHRKK